MLGVGAELAAPENRQDGDRIIIAGRDSAQDSINQVGREMTRRNLNIQPADRATGPAGAHHRQPGSGASAVPAAVLQSGDFTMSTTRSCDWGHCPRPEASS